MHNRFTRKELRIMEQTKREGAEYHAAIDAEPAAERSSDDAPASEIHAENSAGYAGNTIATNRRRTRSKKPAQTSQWKSLLWLAGIFIMLAFLLKLFISIIS